MMDEATWRVCRDLSEMLNHLCATGWGSDRKLRLLACGFCRVVEHLFTDERYRQALDVADRYADGLAGAEELDGANGVVMNTSRRTEEYEWSEDKQAMLLAANAVGWATNPRETPLYLAGCAALGAQSAAVTDGVPEDEIEATQSALIRDIFGPLPVRPVVVPRPVLAWNGGTVVKLAQAIYSGRRFIDLPILADALEEAGCDDPEILTHCRAGGPHVRGCFVVDLLLGRK